MSYDSVNSDNEKEVSVPKKEEEKNSAPTSNTGGGYPNYGYLPAHDDLDEDC